MDGVGGLHEAYIDVEAAAATESSAQSVADSLKALLHGYSGAVGSHSAKGMFVQAKDDDYIPFSVLSDEGAHVVSYTVHAWYSS